MKIPGTPPSLNEIGFVMSIMFLVTFLMALSYSNEAPEITLPPVNLTQIEAVDGAGVTTEDLFIVTMAKEPGKAARILVNNKEVDSKGLEEAIGAARPQEVCLRVDKEVLHGEVQEVMWLCVSMGVPRVSFAGERRQEGKNDY
jgi:biopolymer transport protein ExbD